MKNSLLTLLAIAITGCFAFGQSSVTPSVINATEATYKNNHCILDWSIGELALVNQLESSQPKYFVSNGFLQPYTENPAWLNNSADFGDDEIIILPIPTKDILEIDLRTKQKGLVNFRIYDALGRTILTNSFYSYGNGNIEKINLAGERAGAYFLRIELSPEPGYVHKIRSYKIAKL